LRLTSQSEAGANTADSAVLLVVVEQVQCANRDQGNKDPVLQFHITPPFTRPSGPVQPNEWKAQPNTAVIPITVNVIANAKTIG
jgi:hypothetical protein